MALFPTSVEFDTIIGIEFIECSGSKLSCLCDDNQRSYISHQTAEKISKGQRQSQHGTQNVTRKIFLVKLRKRPQTL
jgi:uncharacterized protein (UPF0333 family)